MRILLVEDDHPLATTMVDMLREDQHTVDWLDDGRQACQALLDEHFDLTILDLTLPRMDGLDIVQKVRSSGINTPIIILTARSQLDDKLQGLDTGADDYLTKPFAMAELKARIRAIQRRGSGAAPSRNLQVGALVLDTEDATLSTDSHQSRLPRSEYQILLYLMKNPGRVASRQRLEEQLYGWDQGVESNTLEVHIYHLRRRIGKEAIKTVRGVGYLLNPEALELPS
ncbi:MULTISPECIES: response regulator transcription factor [Gammaproteobacteria]|uniref:response regulator transcription factor n=1 Tax=Gammaproteobacteria TaxID=1236 RepID=UPI00124A2792|nr:response regulator transcription factor [Halospina sp. K52047b]KAA8980362.1 response regulator transcription factor [Halospina sp. K52047b]